MSKRNLFPSIVDAYLEIDDLGMVTVYRDKSKNQPYCTADVDFIINNKVLVDKKTKLLKGTFIKTKIDLDNLL